MSTYPVHTVVNASTFVEILRWRAQKHPEQLAYTFLNFGEATDNTLTYGELDRRARSIATMLQHFGKAGKTILLLYPSCLEYVAAFFGCLYAGDIAIPAYPPRTIRVVPRIQAIINDSRATIVLTTKQIHAEVEQWFTDVPALENLQWIVSDDTSLFQEKEWQEVTCTSDTLAYLQYTSGSTSTPKGVMVSHGNLIHNCEFQRERWHLTPKSVIVSWLPIFHDMGLIGAVLQTVYAGCTGFLMEPTRFVQRPLRWLETVSHYRGTFSFAPNFAFELCVRKSTTEDRLKLDLSSWDTVINAAEPIRSNTLDRFVSAFNMCGFRREFFKPAYGLAEATLVVSCEAKGSPPVVKSFDKAALEHHKVVEASADTSEIQQRVGCGTIDLRQKVVIVHPEQKVCCPTDEIGEIWISGDSVAKGYFERSSETEQTFKSFLADTGEGPFLRTGDLGFFKDGELFIAGRIKDLIIVMGRNHYPQDIELTVEESHSALRPGCSAAFTVDVDNEEKLVIVAEVYHHYKPIQELKDALEDEKRFKYINKQVVINTIRRAVAEKHSLQVYQVMLLSSGSILKTSSGKIQRQGCRACFLDGSLKEWNGQSL